MNHPSVVTHEFEAGWIVACEAWRDGLTFEEIREKYSSDSVLCTGAWAAVDELSGLRMRAETTCRTFGATYDRLLTHVREDATWKQSAVAEGKAKLRAEHELRLQERATRQLSEEVIRLSRELDAMKARIADELPEVGK